MNSIWFNGKIVSGDEPVLMASNRGYRYGDGLFETIKVVNGNTLLTKYHFERLFEGLSLLKFEIPRLFTREKIEQEIERDPKIVLEAPGGRQILARRSVRIQ